MTAPWSHPRTPAAPVPRTEARPAYYVPLPRRLLCSLRDTPLAIGVYALIARVYRATKAAVPLSPADIARYDPAASSAAAQRALRRLVQAGYLLVTPSGGRRNAYLPTWGSVADSPRPWDLAAPCLGRPRHLAETRLPQALLDSYLGRLEPNANRGAHVTRYSLTPLLTLADVGAYALSLAGYGGASTRLTALGLLANGVALPLPTTEALLAHISQRRLLDAESPVALSPAGWARLGFTAPHAPTPTAGGTPLVFVPPGCGYHHGPPIAHPIAHSIGSPGGGAGRFGASPRPRGRVAPATAGSQGFSCREGAIESTPHPPSSQVAAAGGGGSPSPAIPSGSPGASAGEPAATRLLRGIGVRADVAVSLAGRDPAQVGRGRARARVRQGVRDLAAWVVSALRALPASEEQAPPPPRVSDLAILTHPGLTNAERQRWLTRFRNADPAERGAILARFHAEHPLEECDVPAA